MRRIALVYSARSEFDLKVMAGVAAYIQERQHPEAPDASESLTVKIHDVGEFRSWQADGIVANLDHPAVSAAARDARIPIVGFGEGCAEAAENIVVPYLSTNNEGIGELAAHHLLHLGLERFGYVPLRSRNYWDEQREFAFVRCVSDLGGQCFIYKRGGEGDTADDHHSLGRWLRRFPKPIGIMAANDARACEIIESCHAYGLKIPQQVAIVGVDNNELLCHLSWPSLTSVDRGASRIGYEAAVLLHRLMDGKRISLEVVIEPTGVVVRQSTARSVNRDPFVTRAIRFIESHHSQHIKVSDVVSASGTSATMPGPVS